MIKDLIKAILETVCVVGIVLAVVFMSKVVHASTFGCTGFFITPNGEIATAAHCAPANSKLKVLQGMVLVPATILAVDVAHDVAIIKIESTNTDYFKLASNNPNGAFIMVAGFPNMTVNGINMKIYRGYVESVYQTTLNLRVFSDHGASGAPIFNKYGECFGVLVAGLESMDVSGSFNTFGSSIVSVINLARALHLHIKEVSPIISNMISAGEEKFQRDFVKEKVVLIVGEV